MKDITDNVTGELPYDQLYIDWLTAMRKRVAAITTPIYETDAQGLWQLYLNALPEPIRQQHNCHCCRHFFERYAHLVHVEDGIVKSVFWNDDECMSDNNAAVEWVQLKVQSSRVTNRFWIDGAVAGEYKKGGFDHIAAELPETAVVRSGLSAYQRIAASKEDLKNMRFAMSQLKDLTVKTALQLLVSGTLQRSEVAIQQAQFLASLYDMDRMQFLVAVSGAPAGFLHPRSSMISTLLEDIENGYSTDDISKRWALKMGPLAYQRPQAAPSAGAIDRAEKLFAEMGLETALQRRAAQQEDFDKFAIWVHRPKVVKKAEGLFGALREGSEPGVVQASAPIKITFTKFVKSVLPNAETVQYESGNLYVGTVAADLESKPILQWDDGGENRKTYAWWTSVPSFNARDFGITSGEKLLGCVLGGWMDGLETTSQHGHRAFWYGKAKKAVRSYSGLFPQFLRSELREVRSVVEAHNTRTSDAQNNDIALFSVDVVNSLVVVTVAGVKSMYHIDRWD